MEKDDIIIGLLKENNRDTKEILQIIPTLQTKKECETIRSKKNNKWNTALKYILTTLISLAAIGLSTYAIFH